MLSWSGFSIISSWFRLLTLTTPVAGGEQNRATLYLSTRLGCYLPGSCHNYFLFSFQEFFYALRSCPVATYIAGTENERLLCSPLFSLRHPRDYKSTTISKGNLVEIMSTINNSNDNNLVNKYIIIVSSSTDPGPWPCRMSLGTHTTKTTTPTPTLPSPTPTPTTSNAVTLLATSCRLQ